MEKHKKFLLETNDYFQNVVWAVDLMKRVMMMKSDDYMFLYSNLSSDKIPLHIKEKIDSGDDFTEVEQQEILKIIRTYRKFNLTEIQ